MTTPLEQFYASGCDAARLKFALALPASTGGFLSNLLPKLKSFGAGQLGAAKELGANLRGGLGGAMNPNVISGAVPSHSMDLARGTMRQEALGNLRTLAPSLGIAGGLYGLHRMHQNSQDQQRQRQMLAMQGYGM